MRGIGKFLMGAGVTIILIGLSMGLGALLGPVLAQAPTALMAVAKAGMIGLGAYFVASRGLAMYHTWQNPDKDWIDWLDRHGFEAGMMAAGVGALAAPAVARLSQQIYRWTVRRAIPAIRGAFRALARTAVRLYLDERGAMPLPGWGGGGATKIPPNGAQPPKWNSTDPLVADLANEIELLYPGHVQGVNVPLFDAAGKMVTDADILLKNAVIQVKSGTRAAGILRQLARLIHEAA